jgi:hypothetical protein
MCEYCNCEFSPNGLTAHRRRCKRAKPEDRVLRIATGQWRNQPESRSNFVPLQHSRSRKSGIANFKINAN